MAMDVLRPSTNIQTGTPETHGYIAYDFAAEPNGNALSSFSGIITDSKSTETRHWLANTPSDPFPHPRALNTADYGNYVRIKSDDGFVQLLCHLKPSTPLPMGTRVSVGQPVGQIGFTGNCTGPHLHTEYRYANGVRFAVNFVNGGQDVNLEDVFTQMHRGFYPWKSLDEAKAFGKAKAQAGVSPEQLALEMRQGERGDFHSGFYNAPASHQYTVDKAAIPADQWGQETRKSV